MQTRASFCLNLSANPFRASALFNKSVARLFGLLLLLFGFQTAQAQPYSNETLPIGTVIIDMGQPTQTFDNTLSAYGLVYKLVSEFNVPVKWVINPNKATKDGIDFTYNSEGFKGGPFLISGDLVVGPVATVISNWESSHSGFRTVTTTSAITVPVYTTITYYPVWTLDQQNGSIAQGYIQNADIPQEAYNFKDPQDLDCCDQLFAMPHADPVWSTHSNLLPWNLNCDGSIWAACHAVSALENMYNPSNQSEQTNFLSNKDASILTPGGSDWFDNSLILWGDHDDGSLPPPYIYNNANAANFPTSAAPGTLPPAGSSYASHPVMQFLGSIDEATTNGSEQIYMPRNGTSWRNTTAIAVYDNSQDDVLNGDSPGEAAVMAFGQAFGDNARGNVMYEAGHSHNKGSAPVNVAAQRAFHNFSLWSLEKTKILVSDIMGISLPATVQQGQTITGLNVMASGGTGNFSYEWSSTCGGNFSNPFGASTSFTAPLSSGTCLISVKVTDDCGTRIAFNSVPITVVDGPPSLDPPDPMVDACEDICVDGIDLLDGAVFNQTLAPYTVTIQSVTGMAGATSPAFGATDGGGFVELNQNSTNDPVNNPILLTYYPQADFYGTVTVTFEACASGGVCGTATVTINVTADACSAGQSCDDGSSGSQFIYALAGGKTSGFYQYDIANNTWSTLAPTPANIEEGGALVYDGTFIYALRGGDKEDFYRYDIGGDTWTSRANTLDKVKDGGSLVYDGAFIYALRGDDEFYRYDIGGDSWITRDNTPDKVKDGGSLVYDGTFIYALRGDDENDFYRYDIGGDTWTSRADTPDKVKDGGSLVYDGTFIYALRGDDEFYRYDIGGNTWTSRANTPDNVKGGGSLVYDGTFIYALRGGDENDFYRYDIGNNSWTSLSDAPANIDGGGALVLAGSSFDCATCSPCASSFPVAQDDGTIGTPLTFTSNTPLVISVLNDNGNGADTEPNSQTMTVRLDDDLTQPSNGVVSTNGTTVTYTPDTDYSGTDQFEYRICDEDCRCDVATVYVGSSNQPPTDPEGFDVPSPNLSSCEPRIFDVLADDSDPEGGTILITGFKLDDDGVPGGSPGASTMVSNQGATLELVGGGASMRYTPPNTITSGTSPDVFWYTVCDDFSPPACTDVYVVVNYDPSTYTNLAPNAVNDLAEDIIRNQTAFIPVLQNDSDPEGFDLDLSSNTPATLNATINFNPAYGSPYNASDVFEVTATKINFTPPAGYLGQVTFNYEVCDIPMPGTGCTLNPECATATVTVNVINQPPVAFDDMATTGQDQAITINVKGNDTDLDGDSFDTDDGGTDEGNFNGISGIGGNLMTDLGGTIVINGDGSITYTPPAGQSGVTDAFRYQICDNVTPGFELCDIAEVTIDIEENIDLATGIAVSPNMIEPGSAAIYTVTVTNESGTPATDVALDVNLPTGLAFVQVNNISQGSYDSMSGSWFVGNLPAGETRTLELLVLVNDFTDATGFAQVSNANEFDTDSAPNNNITNMDSAEDDDADATPSCLVIKRNINVQKQ